VRSKEEFLEVIEAYIGDKIMDACITCELDLYMIYRDLQIIHILYFDSLLNIIFVQYRGSRVDSLYCICIALFILILNPRNIQSPNKASVSRIDI
jgi:hypothetical protein